ncbi:leucyl aminopeptidase [Labrys monachus]|uniref:Probable cytosol aminopeptidase n=1 Tax=Labrys monachus TaxID=217067 RepID=A0ABU0FHZ5_9HYPH|nr:leucyl aminopeptidase [Labrys monachus]MDQ0394227.1 leucyl aminopeptidase [Labrys monachus]
MVSELKLSFSKIEKIAGGIVVVFVDGDVTVTAGAEAALPGVGGTVKRAAAADNFKGKALSFLDILAPADLPVDRLLVVSLGKADEAARTDWVKAGGSVLGRLPPAAKAACIILDAPGITVGADQAADFSLGARLRAYAFDRYKTRRKEEDEARGVLALTIATAQDGGVKKALKSRDALADGVNLARDLVNEPPNVLFPEEFARRAAELAELGVEIEVLDPKAMKKLGMGALLGVGQGSKHESRLVVMRWQGAKDADAKPVAFIGKGVTFDTGGISIKPAGSMEDMKGDMGGAACVVGLMHALAARKAKVNAIGAIGIVENMPDGNAQRPGDIVTSMSGQTIEIINTDAEGRLVLADVLWYIQDKYSPRFMVNLATLTGAILVALGQEYAGLFSNDDELSNRLFAAGKATGERVWRMPLGPEYDKMIDSKFADMKNTGGRNGGSITAAQFLQRFVNDTPWAHLDIAGTAMGSPATDINRSWASGWGVRLLDRLVADHYEG